MLLDIVGYTIGHTHDDRYYTEDEVDAAVAAAVAPKANSADVYTKPEVDAYRSANSPLFASITSNGSVLAGISNGVVSSARVSPGEYTITFNRDVESCSPVTSDWTFAVAREISADVLFDLDPNTVTVIARNSASGALEDAVFSLVVQCPSVVPGAPMASSIELTGSSNPNE